ncbi:MAG: ferrous iron transport protein B [Candidatus Hodarchaeales archaeon]
MLTVALVGNPNVGKSVVFNALTGLQQHIANFPRTTVEKKTGIMLYQHVSIEITDLPGIYSLTAHSTDEIVSRDFILDQEPQLVINIIDASNFERNLYLTLQLIELQVPLVICLNKTDLAASQGIYLDSEKLSKILGVHVIEMVAVKGKGIDSLRHFIGEAIQTTSPPPKVLPFNSKIEDSISTLEKILHTYENTGHRLREHRRWIAIKILEDDEDILSRLKEKILNGRIFECKAQSGLKDPPLEFAEARYRLIEDIISQVLTSTQLEKRSKSDLLDDVLTHRFLGIPIFIILMWLVFEFTFSIARPFTLLIEIIFTYLGTIVSNLFPGDIAIVAEFLNGTIIDGIGSIVIFLPNIVFLFLAIAILEDSGYIARATFLMDKVLTRLGLHGQSFIPMVLGFGCTVPAIMSTRGLRSDTDRMVTILVTPFISCGARLPVYIIFSAAFFPNSASLVTFSLYLLGIVVAVVMALILRKTIFSERASSFVIEFPAYLIPKLSSVGFKTWLNSKMFLRKAGGIIFVSVSAIWIMDKLGLIKPLGVVFSIFFAPFNLDWQLSAALLFGLIAKEVVVGSLGTMYLGNSSTESSLTTVLQDPSISSIAGSPAHAFAYMVFVLLYVPCVATISIIKHETNSWKWALFVVVYTIIVAYTASLLALFSFPLIAPIFGV